MDEYRQQNELERLLKHKAEGFELKPSEEVWKKVKQAIDERTEERPFGWWMLALLLLLVGLGTITALYISKKDVPLVSKSGTSRQQLNFANSDSIGILPKIKPSSSFLSDRNDSSNKSEPLSSIQQINPFRNQSALGMETQLLKSYSSGNNSSANRKITPQNNLTTQQMDQKEDWPIFSEEKNDYSSFQSKTIVTIHDLSSPLSSQDDKEMNMLILKSEVLMGEDSASFLISNFKKPLFKKNNHRITVEADFIPLVSYRTFSGSANTIQSVNGTDTIADFRNKTDKLLIALSVEGRINYHFTDKFSVGFGVGFTQFGEQMSLQKVTSSSFTADSSFSGDSTANTHNGTNIQPSDAYTPGHGLMADNRFNTIDFSLGIGWKFFADEKNQMILNPGFGYTRVLSVKSIYYESGQVEVTPPTTNSGTSYTVLESPNSEVLKKNLFHAEAEINYQRLLSEHFSFNAGLALRYYLSDLFIKEYAYTQHPYWLGLKTGIIYRF